MRLANGGRLHTSGVDREELSAWLRLAATPGIGPVTGRRLLSRFGLPVDLFKADAEAVKQACRSARLTDALLGTHAERDRQVGASLGWLMAAAPTPRAILTLADPRYPPRLLHLVDPPLVLHVEGDVGALAKPQIAIVGSRNASAVGLATASELAQALNRRGWIVTSGLAEGIDRAAHQGALAEAGLPGPATIAVMGTGIDRVYPTRHRALAKAIANKGALVSELPPDTPPMAENFPRRNRLIAALSEGVLVVEAATRSGSLITARLAAEIGREVFAVPGSIHSPQSRGCHWLLRQGAALVETVEDVLSEQSLSIVSQPVGPTSLFDRDSNMGSASAMRAHVPGPEQLLLLDLLAGGPATPDTLQRQSGTPIGELMAILQRLELDGRLGSSSDGRWYRLR